MSDAALPGSSGGALVTAPDPGPSAPPLLSDTWEAALSWALAQWMRSFPASYTGERLQLEQKLSWRDLLREEARWIIGNREVEGLRIFRDAIRWLATHWPPAALEGQATPGAFRPPVARLLEVLEQYRKDPRYRRPVPVKGALPAPQQTVRPEDALRTPITLAQLERDYCRARLRAQKFRTYVDGRRVVLGNPHWQPDRAVDAPDFAVTEPEIDAYVRSVEAGHAPLTPMRVALRRRGLEAGGLGIPAASVMGDVLAAAGARADDRPTGEARTRSRTRPREVSRVGAGPPGERRTREVRYTGGP